MNSNNKVLLVLGIILVTISYLILIIYQGHQSLMNIDYLEMEEASKILW